MLCPCKDCEKKGCGAYHAKCEAYLSWKNDYTYRKEKDFIERTASYSEAKQKLYNKYKRTSI